MLNLSSNMTGHEIAKINFPCKLLLTDRQFSHLLKAFANNSSTYIKLSKTQLSKIVKSSGFLGRLLVPLVRKWFTVN